MIQRILLPKLISHLHNPEISIVVGPRQAGKTTLMRLLMDHLKSQEKRSIYLNYDLDADRPFFETQNDLLIKIRLEIGDSGFVFLDEIQRKENAGLFLKGLYDLNTPYKFVVSGSGSLELKEKIAESLAGRKRMFTLYPLDFDEFINFRTDYKYDGKLKEFLNVEKDKGQKLLIEYLNFGGYPKVVLAATLEEKKEAISDIFESYVEKDLNVLLHLKKSEQFTQLVRLLASQNGQLINVASLSSILGMSEKTIKHYLWYLEKTYVGGRVSPFTRRMVREIVKSPVFYFIDPGMANFVARKFGYHDLSLLGFDFQALIYRQMYDTPVHYWRTRDGAEVDFVIDNGQEVIPIEVKGSLSLSLEIPRGLISFIKRYHPKIAYVVNLSLERELRYEQTKIIFVPYYEFQKKLEQ